jgi:peroxiredoxin
MFRKIRCDGSSAGRAYRSRRHAGRHATGDRRQDFKRPHKLRYEALADIDLPIAMAFEIVFRTPPVYEALPRGRSIYIADRSGNPAWLLPIPATLLVRRDGVIARTWINIDVAQRAEPTEILKALKKL